MIRSAMLLVAALLIPGCTTVSTPSGGPNYDPIIIAHRGASSERPEHTLAAYQLAIDQGADYIEPDLVMTRDGVFVARHENEISGTTDIADHPEFADRRTTKVIDGDRVTGWFTEDFTLAELKTLRARERLPDLRPGSAAYDGRYEIATLDEIIALVREQEHSVGIVPEIKHPSYFRSIGLPMEEALARQLAATGYNDASDPAMIQSFEISPLQRLDRLTNLRLVQLIGGSGGPADEPSRRYSTMLSPPALAQVASYADVIGPDKNYIMGIDDQGALEPPSTLVADAHRAGLLVIPYTFRPENYFLPAPMRSQQGAPPESGEGVTAWPRSAHFWIQELTDCSPITSRLRSTRASYSAAISSSAPPRSTETSRLTPRSIIVTP